MSNFIMRELVNPVDWVEFMSFIHSGLDEWRASNMSMDLTGMNLDDPEDYRRFLVFISTAPLNTKPSIRACHGTTNNISEKVMWLQTTPTNMVFIHGTEHVLAAQHEIGKYQTYIYTIFRRMLREDFEDRKREDFIAPKVYFMGYWFGLQQKLVASTSMGLIYHATQTGLLPNALLRNDFPQLFN